MSSSGTVVACHLGLHVVLPATTLGVRGRWEEEEAEGAGLLRVMGHCVDVSLLVSPLQPGRQDQTSCRGKLGERVAPKTQHWDKPIDLISPALHFSFAQTAASGLVNSGHVQSHAHWSFVCGRNKASYAAKELCTGTSFAPDVSITCCTKTRIYQVPQTPGMNSPPTDGCTSPVGRELFLLC